MGRKKMVTVAASVPAWAKMRLEALAKKKMSVRRLACPWPVGLHRQARARADGHTTN